MSHWVEKYVGRQWVTIGRGPTAYDCWGLIVTVLREQYGITMPDNFVGVTWQTFSDTWDVAEKPGDGDVVVMRRPGYPHVGVFVDVNGGRVLHAMEGAGVILSDLPYLRTQGWTPRFYRHVR